MRKLVCVAILACAIVPLSLAGGYVNGKQTGECSFSPSSTVEGSTVTVSASGLTPSVEETLFILNYEVPTNSHTFIVGESGTYSGQYVIKGDGWTTFQFASASQTGSRLAHNDATCRIHADSA